MSVLGALAARARRLKRELFALYLAARDARTPWAARLLLAAVLAYALSPIDLIPDFIPVLGYLDDLILVPLGLMLAVRLVPPQVLRECRAEAARREQERPPPSRAGALLVVCSWLLCAALLGYWLW